MHLQVDRNELKHLLREIVQDLQHVLSWPAGRFALDENEAATACGVGRHVLRDLRLAGKVSARRLGKKIVYSPQDLVNAIDLLPKTGRIANDTTY